MLCCFVVFVRPYSTLIEVAAAVTAIMDIPYRRVFVKFPYKFKLLQIPSLAGSASIYGHGISIFGLKRNSNKMCRGTQIQTLPPNCPKAPLIRALRAPNECVYEHK